MVTVAFHAIVAAAGWNCLPRMVTRRRVTAGELPPPLTATVSQDRVPVLMQACRVVAGSFVSPLKVTTAPGATPGCVSQYEVPYDGHSVHCFPPNVNDVTGFLVPSGVAIPPLTTVWPELFVKVPLKALLPLAWMSQSLTNATAVEAAQ